MDNQLVTIKGIYQDGDIVLLSPFLPKGEFQVLVTFLEPITDKGTNEDGTNGAVTKSNEGFREFKASQIGISKREFEILKLVQKGCTNREISKKLEIGDGTVRNYISALLDKMKAENRTMLVSIAMEKGLLDSREFD